jgi:Abortive infection alpha
MEEASCETEDENIKTMWANLLASARADYKPEYRSFVNILSQFDPHQALILHTMMDHTTYKGRDRAIANLGYLKEAQLANNIENFLIQIKEGKITKERALRRIYKTYYICRFVWEDVAIEDLNNDNSYQLLRVIKKPAPELDIMSSVPDYMTCFDLMQHQFMIKAFETKGVQRKNFIYSFAAYYATSLGIDFYRTCTRQKLDGTFVR